MECLTDINCPDCCDYMDNQDATVMKFVLSPGKLIAYWNDDDDIDNPRYECTDCDAKYTKKELQEREVI